MEPYSASKYYFNGDTVTVGEQAWKRVGTVNVEVPDDTSGLMGPGCPLETYITTIPGGIVRTGWYHVMLAGGNQTLDTIWSRDILGSGGVYPDIEWRARSEDGEWITEWTNVTTSIGTFPDSRSRVHRPFEFWREVEGPGINANYRIEVRSVSGGFYVASEYRGIQR